MSDALASAAKNSADNFTSTRSNSPSDDELGSQPRSSEGIYKQSTIKSLFSPKTVSARLLSVPASVSSAVMAVQPPSISPFRYFIIILVLIFLGLNVFLFLEKPSDKSLSHLYDPVLKWLGFIKKDEPKLNPEEEEKKQNKEIKKMYKKEKAQAKSEMEEGINKANAAAQSNAAAPAPAPAQAPAPAPSTGKKNKYNLPIPDDTTSRLQMSKSKSKAGFCYIGEDRGFRSCIEVGEGDVCMSGDIFPSQEICVNPKLRV